jgi:hypothetical protein
VISYQVALPKARDAIRRLPAPWTADKIPGGHVVRNANGHALARSLRWQP